MFKREGAGPEKTLCPGISHKVFMRTPFHRHDATNATVFATLRSLLTFLCVVARDTQDAWRVCVLLRCVESLMAFGTDGDHCVSPPSQNIRMETVLPLIVVLVCVPLLLLY